MTRKAKLIVKETIEELQNLRTGLSTNKQKRVDMLILTKEGKCVTKGNQAKALNTSERSIQEWRGKYVKGGIEHLLMERRGGNQKSTFDPRIKTLIKVYMDTINKGHYSVLKIIEWLIIEHKYTLEHNLPLSVYKSIKRYMNSTYGKSPNAEKPMSDNID